MVLGGKPKRRPSHKHDGNFYILLTMHLGTTCVNNQLDALL